MSLKLGAIELNKIPFGAGDINKAYLGTDIVFSAAPLNEYLLNLDAVNKDYLTIPTVGDWLTVNDIDFEISFSLTTTISPDFRVLFSRSISTPNRIDVFLRTGGGISFRVTNDTVGLIVSDISSVLVVGVNHVLKYVGSKMYLDGVEIFDNTSVSASALNSGSEPVYVNDRGYLLGSGTNVSLYNFALNGENFPLNEGSGFGFTGSLGTTGTGVTSNAGGLTYWDSSVWTLIV